MSDRSPEDQAALMKRAGDAMIDALEKCGGLDNSNVALSAAAMVAGCVIAATANPEASLRAVIKGIRGIMDGSLLDP